MPFKSQAQRAYLFANDPSVAKEFASHTPKGKKLPRRVKRYKRDATTNRLVRKPLRKRKPSKLAKARGIGLRSIRNDPTRTATLRRAFLTALRKRFAKFKRQLLDLVVKEDAFGLKEISANYDPDEPRDEQGRWTSAGGATGTGKHDPEVSKLFKRGHESKFLDALNHEESKALAEYKGDDPYANGAAIALNGTLRDGGKLSIGQEKAVEHLDSAFRKAPRLKEPTTLYRGVSEELPTYGKYGFIESKAYTSTSTSKAEADNFSTMTGGHGVVYHIKVPKNFVAMPTSHFHSGTSIADEHEVLLPRNISMKVTGRSGNIIHAEIVGGELWMMKKVEGYTTNVATLPLSSNEQTTLNTRFKFHTDSEKVVEFKRWLAQNLKHAILGTMQSEIENAWWKQYVLEGYKKGAGRSFDDVRKPALIAQQKEKLDFYKGSKAEFLRSSFAQPVAVDKVKFLAGRVFTELDGVTDTMAQQMTRVLTDGLVQGDSPIKVGKELAERVDVGESRAQTIARTETIRAHAEGQLDSLVNLGVEHVGVMVEWSTTGDDLVCPECEPMEGVVITIDEARNQIPMHPSCRCAWIPANVGEDDEDQVRGKEAIEERIDKSTEAGGDFDSTISKSRPESILNQEWNELHQKLDNYDYVPESLYDPTDD